MNALLIKSDVSGLKLLRRGKVRDVYDAGDKLLIVATDRLSAFDHILPTPIPGKGVLLTQISAFWFGMTKNLVPNHVIATDLARIQKLLPLKTPLDPEEYGGRTMLVKKARRLDVECVVRGYLAGSGWKDYQKTGAVCGQRLPAGLRQADKLDKPLFTPATKSDTGHDENISREKLAEMVGKETAKELERLSVVLYEFAASYLKIRGCVLADTKFEFGRHDGRLIVIDEMLTPDSSRLWPARDYKPGTSPPSFDKQYVRDYLESLKWDKQSPPPALPPKIVEETVRRYRQFLDIISS